MGTRLHSGYLDPSGKFQIEGEAAQQQDYLKPTLTGAPPLLEIPADRVRPPQHSYAGDFIGLVLDEELTLV
jgi:hypothetical protein